QHHPCDGINHFVAHALPIHLRRAHAFAFDWPTMPIVTSPWAISRPEALLTSTSPKSVLPRFLQMALATMPSTRAIARSWPVIHTVTGYGPSEKSCPAMTAPVAAVSINAEITPPWKQLA